MNKSLLIRIVREYLRYYRDRVKGTGEYARMILGSTLRFLKVVDYDLKPIGHSTPVEFREYSNNNKMKVQIVTPSDGHYMTTFFDVEPISPNGRYLCVTKVPFISRIPIPGDLAQICILDIEKKQIKSIYNTKGWGAQLGANVQWVDDESVVFNDVIKGKVVGVKVNVHSLDKLVLEGPIYGLSPDRKFSYSGNLDFINALLPGYGAPDRLMRPLRQRCRVSEDEGVWKTDIETGKCELFISIADLLKPLQYKNEFHRGISYIFNVKVNPAGDKLLIVMFAKNIPFRKSRTLQLLVVDIKTKDVRIVLNNERWRLGGHHPNWMQGGDEIVMNLVHNNEGMKFVKINPDSGGIAVFAGGFKGGGHPSIAKDGKYLMTDSYTSEGYIDSAGKVPIRMIDLSDLNEAELCRVDTKGLDGPRRIDPHPVWSGENNSIVFNAIDSGFRQVFLARKDNDSRL